MHLQPSFHATSHEQQAVILSISQHELYHCPNNSRLPSPLPLRHGTSFSTLSSPSAPSFQFFKLTRCLFQVLSATIPYSESLQPVHFRGDYGGHAYELNGSAQSVLAQLKALHPEIELPERGTFSVESRAVLNKVSPSNIFNLVIYIERSRFNWYSETRFSLPSAFPLAANLLGVLPEHPTLRAVPPT
jgi:hypothetical protein